MSRIISCADTGHYSLEECVEALQVSGFDPQCEDNLSHAALCLRRLGNDRQFLGDHLIRELRNGLEIHDEVRRAYGPQAIVLSEPRDGFFLRANIWPSRQDHCFRSSGAHSFAYGVPHDHNFDFLTLGYFGPGYESDYFEYDHAAVAGYRGEPVGLSFVERARLDPGKIMLYRAHRDIHLQHPPESLSISLNIMAVNPDKAWVDQYSFDLEKGTIASVLSPTSTETFLRIAVALGDGNALDLAEDWSSTHSSERIRLACYESRAGRESREQAERIWREADRSGTRLLEAEARIRLDALAKEGTSLDLAH